MRDTHLILKDIDMGDVKNILRTFSGQRRYVFEIRELPSHEALITLYNKKPESSVFVSLVETFASRFFIPHRIKVQIKIGQDKGDCNVSISGEVMMAEMDIVDPDPRPAGIARLNHVMGEIASVLTQQGISSI